MFIDIKKMLFVSSISLLASSCTWVPITPEAAQVQVLPAGNQAYQCQENGEVLVSVKKDIGFYERNSLRVQEELETLARNEAITLGGNAVQPLSDQSQGSQRFRILNCGYR